MRHLRSGQLTDVYEGVDLRDGRKIAIELLRSPYAEDQNAIATFIGAHHAAMRLSHPNVAQVRTVRDADGEIFMVREPLEHQTLEALLTDRGRLPPRRASGIALGMCEALEHAHRHNMVHGALTAADVLLTATGDVRVTGFGIATAMGTADQPAWVEPDRQTDLYALGACLYHMLLGRAPFPGDAHAGERAVSRAPEGLATVLSRLLSLDPADGYQSMADAADDLRHYRRSAVPAGRREDARGKHTPAVRDDRQEDEDDDDERLSLLHTGSYIFSRSAITVAASVVVVAVIMVTAGQFGLGSGLMVTGDRAESENSAAPTTTGLDPSGDDDLGGIGGATTSESTTTSSSVPDESDEDEEDGTDDESEDDADQDGEDDQDGEEPGDDQDTTTTSELVTTTTSEPSTTTPPDSTTTTEAPATVPGVVGLTESEAASRLSAAGLGMSSRRVRVYDADQDGRVVSQSPPAGAPVPASGTVDVEVGNQCFLIC